MRRRLSEKQGRQALHHARMLHAQRVVSDVPSRREMACDVVQKMVERLGADDLLTLIGFDDDTHMLAQAISPNDMDAVFGAIQQLSSVGGGGTNMGKAFEAVRDV